MLIQCSIERFTEWRTECSSERSNQWLTDWLLGWFIQSLTVDWMEDWLRDWMLDWEVDWLSGRRGQFSGCLSINLNFSRHENGQLSRQINGCLSTSTKIRLYEYDQLSVQLNMDCVCISTNLIKFEIGFTYRKNICFRLWILREKKIWKLWKLKQSNF